MRGLKPFLYLLLGCVVCAIISGCAGSIPQNGPKALIIRTSSLSDGVPHLAYQQSLQAVQGQPPYTWSISAGSLPPGLSLSADGVISGTPTTLGKSSFTVQVTDTQTPTAAVQTAPLSITINPPLTFTPSSLPNGVVGVSYTTTVTASNGVAPYTYAVVPNAGTGLPPCTASPSGHGQCNPNMDVTTSSPPSGGGANSGIIGSAAATETPTTAGVYNFTLQVTDALQERATAAFTITITGQLQGTHAFTFNGFDNGQPFYIVGSFCGDGDGNINPANNANCPGAATPCNGSVGVYTFDQSSPSGVNTCIPFTGTYKVPSGTQLGSITLTSSLGTFVYQIVVSTKASSTIILADPNHTQMWGSGTVTQQATTTLFSGVSDYTFGLFGATSSGNRYAGAGTIALDTSLAITGGEEDTNDNGTPSGELPITGGAIATPDSNTGRGTLSLNVTVNGNPVTYNYAYYTTSKTNNGLVAVSTDPPDSNHPATVVSLLPQQGGSITGSTFSNASLGCTSPSACIVLQLNGASATGVPDASVGVATFDGNGSITRSGIDSLPGYFTDENNGGTVSQNSYNGTYNVDSSGRVTVTLNSNGQPIPHQPVWYLVRKNQGFVVGTDPLVTSGQFNPQTGAPFTLASFLGPQYLGGTVTPTSSNVTNEIDVAGQPPPGGIWKLTYETSGPAGIPANEPLSFTGAYDCGTFQSTNCTAEATNFGRFRVTTSTGQLVRILYITGQATNGTVTSANSLVDLNVGNYNGSKCTSYSGTVSACNPRLTSYGK